ncbi:hypothetical protein F383_06372 [Gossypium arboreum]|uniref:Uncharacterized protein n=1 Tax=Gossypium arboreum TaxID=29729 RepID=A0A0B0PIC0_GOSAR|nr:hypothetical protein F383_06372 [Gossypium arboreum]
MQALGFVTEHDSDSVPRLE